MRRDNSLSPTHPKAETCEKDAAAAAAGQNGREENERNPLPLNCK